MTRAEVEQIIARELARPSNGPQGQEYQGRPPSRLLTLPGTVVQLARGESKTISAEANDPLINEWGVYISVEPESFQILRTEPVTWGVRMQVLPSFDSANFTYYRPSNTYQGKLVPVVGVALAVHGQRVNVQLKRDSVGDNINGTMVLMAAIAPRLPGLGVDTSNGQVSNAAAFQDVIPSMARTLRVMTNVAVGDAVIFRTPGETIISSILMTSDMLLKPIMIPKMAYKFEYFTVTLAAKDILVDYETVM